MMVVAPIVCFSFSGIEEIKQIKRPNILFIPIDDLRPELGCYGNNIIKTPNIDKLAYQGVVFDRAYCQQALCNPSRASLLTGLRPDSIQVWDLIADFRSRVPNAMTLPQFFKEKGYTTIGIGKTFHNDIPDDVSWTQQIYLDGFPFDPDAVYANEENLSILQKKINGMKEKGRLPDRFGHYYAKARAVEKSEVDDDFYYDGAQTTRALQLLNELNQESEPFFLSVGYYRPHLPFNAPKKYWDLYNASEIPLASNPYLPLGSPDFAVHGDWELRNYTGSNDLPFPNEAPWSVENQRLLKQGYYASVSYIDAQVGRLLSELERLGLSDNTIIVLWGDHGWKLGEHNSWGKMSNYEVDTRVPLIISGAGVKAKGSHTTALTEFVDIYPTLCEMAGFEVPQHLQGTSLTPLLANVNLPWKKAAFSQYLLGRFGPNQDQQTERMGYTIRTDQFRYVEWYRWKAKEKERGDLIGLELFDHYSDPDENNNLANSDSFQDTIKNLSAQLRAGYKHARPK